MLPSHSPYQTNNSAPGGSQAHFFPTQQQIPMQAQMPTQQNPPQQMMSPQVLIPCPACPRPLPTSHMPQVLIPCPACPRPLFLHPICPRYSSLVLLVLTLSSYIPYAPGTHPLSYLSSPTLLTSHTLHLKYVNLPPKHSSALIRTHSTLCPRA